MLRRTLTVLIASIALVLGTTASAQALQASAIKATTTTPVVAAGTGVATFVAGGLPSGRAYLQRWDTAKGSWVRAAVMAKKGTRGSASVTGLAAGVHRFRVYASGKKSTVMRVRAVAASAQPTWFDGPGQPTLFNSTMFPMQSWSGVPGTVTFAAEHQCTSLNLAMGPVSGNFSGWYLEAAIASVGFGPRVIRTDTGTGILQKDIPISGTTTITFTQSNTSMNQFGMQAYCLTSPF